MMAMTKILPGTGRCPRERAEGSLSAKAVIVASNPSTTPQERGGAVPLPVPGRI